MANARCMRAAQARGVDFTPASSGPAASGADEAVGSGSTRPYATTRSRHRAGGANTPWQMSRLVSGRGVIAAKRSRNSSGRPEGGGQRREPGSLSALSLGGFREMAFMSLTLNLVMMTCFAAAAATLTF